MKYIIERKTWRGATLARASILFAGMQINLVHHSLSISTSQIDAAWPNAPHTAGLSPAHRI